jgi:hypothetical protein
MLALAGCGGGGRPTGPASTIPGSPAWYAASTPLAIEYLRTLPDSAIGQPMAGIVLADGQRWLEGFVYRGVVPVEHPGMHVVSVVPPLERPETLVWIDEGGEPWLLPECGGDLVGIRARTIAGEVYTWKALRPGSGIVRTACPPEDWPPPGPSEVTP